MSKRKTRRDKAAVAVLVCAGALAAAWLALAPWLQAGRLARLALADSGSRLQRYCAAALEAGGVQGLARAVQADGQGGLICWQIVDGAGRPALAQGAPVPMAPGPPQSAWTLRQGWYLVQGAPLPGTGWHLVQQLDVRQLAAPLVRRGCLQALAVLAALGAALAVHAVCRRQAVRQALAARQARRQAARARRLHRRLLADAQHHLRTPLHGLLGMAHAAQSHLHEPDKLRGCLKHMQKAETRLQQAADDLLRQTKETTWQH